MSGDLVAESCPTYAVVDKRKKKKVAEMDQESSADIALYAVVDKAKRSMYFLQISIKIMMRMNTQLQM